MLLTNDSKKQSTNLRFRINEYKNNVLYTELVGLRIQVAQLKRITRKQKDKVEDSFVCVTKEFRQLLSISALFLVMIIIDSFI